MRTKRLAVITIGQAPRVDVLPIIYQFFAPEEVVHVGVLDELSAAEIHALAPTTAKGLLTSRLKDGTAVYLSKEKIYPLLNEKIQFAEQQGCDLIYLLCTGSFTGLKTTTSLLIEPDKVLGSFLQQINSGDYKLGVLLPLADQKAEIAVKYQEIRAVVYTALSPYEKQTEAKVAKAAQFFKAENCDLILLDCMGYSKELKQRLLQKTGIKTLISNEMISAMLAVLV